MKLSYWKSKTLLCALCLLPLFCLNSCKILSSEKTSGVTDDPDSVLAIDPSMEEFINEFNQHLKGKDYKLSEAVLKGKDCTEDCGRFGLVYGVRSTFNLSPEVKNLVSPLIYLDEIPNNKCNVAKYNFILTVGEDRKVLGLLAKTFNESQIKDLRENCFPPLKTRMKNYVDNLTNETSLKKIAEQSRLVSGNTRKEVPKITTELYYKICDLKDVSLCPIDPNTGKKVGTCSTLNVACENFILSSTRKDVMYDAQTYFKSCLTAKKDYPSLTGDCGHYLVRGDVLSFPKKYRADLVQYRNKHLNEITQLYNKACKKGNTDSCDYVKEISVTHYEDENTETQRTVNNNPINEQKKMSNYASASPDFCSTLTVNKIFSGMYVLGRPTFVIEVLSRNSSPVSITEVNENRKGFKPSRGGYNLLFGDRAQVTGITDAIEIQLKTNNGVCVFSFNE